MKISTVKTMIAYLNGETVDTAALMDELTLEVEKHEKSGADRASAKHEARKAFLEKASGVVMAALANCNAPVEAKKLFEENEDAFCAVDVNSASTLQYMLLHDLPAVKVIDNGRNAKTYTLA